MHPQQRGRSRLVSPVARARLASEERRRADTDRLEKRMRQKKASRRAVPFKDVVSAMNGELFPLDPSERADDARRITGLPIAGACPHRASVRAELLDSLLGHGERRTATGKTVPPSESSSRSSSWLSFGSWRSTATDITTPDCPVLPSPKQRSVELFPHASFVRIAIEESPLCPPHDDPRPPPPPPRRGTLVMRVSRSLVEAAKGLQSAYISATMFAAGDTPHHHRPQRHLRPQGYRVCAKDVQRFIATAPQIGQVLPVHFIPLVSATAAIPKSPLPKDVILFPSPLRPRTPPSALAYRMRPIANPAVLRLKALQNIMCARGKEWEGHARDGALGCGKERMLGIAFEGRGPSALGCELRFVVT